MRSVILASQSPRRRDLLQAMGVPFTALVSHYQEQLDNSRSPQAVAEQLGLGKAMAVAEQYPLAVVIGSDTIVEIDGLQLEKPRDLADARATLRRLAGKTNRVVTSLAVVCLDDGFQSVQTDTVEVTFKAYDAAVIETYLASGDYADKAGSYGIQSGAAPLIDHMRGHYDAVVGLPTHLLAPVLKQLDITATPVELVPPVPVLA